MRQHRNKLILVLYSIAQIIVLIACCNLDNCAGAEINSKDDNGGSVPVEKGEQKLEEAIELLKEHQDSGVDPVKVVQAGVESIDVEDPNQTADKAVKAEGEVEPKNNKPVADGATVPDEVTKRGPIGSASNGPAINKNVIGSSSIGSAEHDRNLGDDHGGFDHLDQYDRDQHDPLDPATAVNEPNNPRAGIAPNNAPNSAPNNEQMMRGANNHNELPEAHYPGNYRQENGHYVDDNDDDDELHRVDDAELDPEEEEYMSVERPLDDDGLEYDDDGLLVGDAPQYEPEYADELYDDDNNENLYRDQKQGPPGPIPRDHADPALSAGNGLNEVPFSRSSPGHRAPYEGPAEGPDANEQPEPYEDSDDYYDEPNDGQHYEEEWVDHSDPNGPTLNRLKHDEDVWQDDQGGVHHDKSRHKSSSTINDNVDPNNYHEAHQEEHQESKSSVYGNGNGLTHRKLRSFSRNNSHQQHYQSNHQQQQQFYSDSDSDTDSDSDSDYDDPQDDVPPMHHGFNPAVDMAKRALDSLNQWPPRAPFDDFDDGPHDRNQPGQRRARYHYHRYPETAYPRYDDPSDEYEDDYPYDDMANNFYDPYNVDPYNDLPPHAAATAVAGNQMPGASSMASSSTFGPDGIGRSHVVSDRSYLRPDGQWVREHFSNRDGEITSNVYPIDGSAPFNRHAGLHGRHRSKIEKMRAKHNKVMSKMAKRQRKMHERLMRKHNQNVNGAMARAQAVADGRGLF